MSASNARPDRRKPGCIVVAAATLIAGSGAVSAGADELVVTANKSPRETFSLIGNNARLDGDEIELTNYQHIYELGQRVAGTWISRGSGQEHLTAIRSPVLTGAGACGAFLMLENGVATRPTGFCNINQLFEVPAELASAVEIIRGPANALYGSNGLHGTLNVLLPEADRPAGLLADLSLGPNGFGRGTLRGGGAARGWAWTGGLLADEYDGFRNDSGYAQQKAFVTLRRETPRAMLDITFSGSNLNQETAGFVRGENVYRDEQLRTTNPNPEAFRDADSQRLTLRWSALDGHRWAGSDLRAWLRRSDMEFLQHFLPGQPLEENGQLSAGASFVSTRPGRGNARVSWGVDAEFARGFLEEFQFGPVDSPSAFLVETRPAGPHYDYDVRSALLAAYTQLETPLHERWSLQAGLRVEYLYYDYDNQLPAGNLRVDGTPCGFGGCLFNRPADRSDGFVNAAPNLGVAYRFSEQLAAFAGYSRGFRAPQVTELYRLQNDQSVADLDSELLDSVELGVRWRDAVFSIEAIAFAMRKENYIFRDADGFNISDGESRHLGIELSADVAFDAGLYGDIATSWSRQTYRFDRDVAAGETINKDNEVDTAPRTLGSARLGYARTGWRGELEWVHQGSYYLDAANTSKYSGHNLLNFRALWQVLPRWSLGLRVNNLLDARYADRADFAFGSFRYFPGREREWLVQIRYHSHSAESQ